jgi:CRP-like cAMP-binding protein
MDGATPTASRYHPLEREDPAALGSPGRNAAEGPRSGVSHKVSVKLARSASEDLTLRGWQQQGLMGHEEEAEAEDEDEDAEGANTAKMRRAKDKKRYCEIDELLSEEVGSLAKIFGLNSKQGSRQGSRDAPNKASSEDLVPEDVKLLHRWRCWLGSYNVAVATPEETGAERVRRLFTQQRMKKAITGSTWSDLLGSPKTKRQQQLSTLSEAAEDEQGEESDEPPAEQPAEQPAEETSYNEEEPPAEQTHEQERGCLRSRGRRCADRCSATAKSCCCARQKKNISRWVVCYSWFWFLVVTLGMCILACASWADATILNPMIQRLEHKLPALNISLTANGVTSSFLVSVSDRMDIAVESRESEVAWTHAGGPLVVGPGKLGAIHFRELMLPPGAHVHEASLLLEAVGHDPRMLAEAPMPLEGAYGQARGAAHARSAPQDIDIFAETVSDSEPFAGSKMETRMLSKRIWQPYLRTRSTVWSVPRSAGAVRSVVTTTDMSAALQELVDLPDWTTRSGVTLFLEHTGGEGVTLFTNGHGVSNKLVPTLLTLWWYVSLALQLKFQSPSAKFRIADVSDSHEHRMSTTITRLIVVVNASVALGILVLTVVAVHERECTASGWFIRVVVSIMTMYSLNLFALWTAYFWIACNHLLEVITSKWQLISQQTPRLVNALLKVANLSSVDQANALQEYKDSRAAMEQIALAMKPHKFRRRELIIDDREEITKHSEMYIIDTGEVRVTELRNGKWIKRTLTDGEAFGEAALRSNRKAKAADHRFLNAIAVVDTTCFALSFHELNLLKREVMEAKDKDKSALLRHCDLFKDLKESELPDLAARMKSEEFSEGEYLMQQDETVDDDSKMYVIVTGTVEIRIKKQDGSFLHFSNEAGGHQGRLLRTHGSYIGEKSFIDKDTVRSATVVATELTKCLSISRREFMPYLESAKIVNRNYAVDGSSENDSRLGGFDLTASIDQAQMLSTMAVGLNEDFRMNLWQIIIFLGLTHLCLLSQIFGETGQTTVQEGGNAFLESIWASPARILPVVAEVLLALVTCLIMLIPTQVSILGDRMVADTNTLQWNMREFCTNPVISQQLLTLVGFLHGINRGNGIGFFLLNNDDGNVSVRLTPSLVKASLATSGMVLLSLFTKHREFIADFV